jgi:hypothetical protein
MIWNPWNRIAELEKKLAEVTAMLRAAESDKNLASTTAAAYALKLANAHFRDPKTGRIGKKGAVK